LAESYTDEGLDYLLNTLLKGYTVQGNLYMGLFTDSTGSTVAAPSATGGATPTGWTEVGGSQSGANYGRIGIGNAATLTVTGVTNATPAVVTTSAVHGFVRGDAFTGAGVGGATGVNISGYANPLTSTTFEVYTTAWAAVAAGGAYTSGGTITPTSDYAGVWATPSAATSVGRKSASAQGTFATVGIAPRIVNATNATPIVYTTYTKHGMGTGNTITVTGITGNTNANVTNVAITRVNDYQFSCAVGNGAFAGTPVLAVPAAFSITSSTNASPVVLTVGAGHGVLTGDTITVAGHTTNTNANGTWVAGTVTGTTIALTGSTGNGVGGATGTVARSWSAWGTANGYFIATSRAAIAGDKVIYFANYDDAIPIATAVNDIIKITPTIQFNY
jgi:hypothetical protein